MDNDFESLYQKERYAKEALISVLDLRLRWLTYSYKKAREVAIYETLGIFGMVFLIALIAVDYFFRGGVRSIIDVYLGFALMCLIGIAGGFFAKRTMQRCFYEIVWYPDAIKKAGFKVVRAYGINDLICIRPSDNEEVGLDFKEINWRSFIDHL